MVWKLASLTAALALLGAAPAAGAQVPPAPVPPVHGVPVSELIGLDPAAVRARLAGVAADWPVPAAFEVAAPAGRLSFITLGELMTDPVLAQRMAAFRTHGDPIAFAPHLQCKAVLARLGASPQSAGSVVLMFRDGRLDAALLPVEAAPPPVPNPADQKAMIAYERRPRSSPFVANFGELPLEDSLGFLARWTRTALSRADELAADCAAAPSPAAAPARLAHHALDAGDMQGLALLPFAVTLPAKNRQRVAAREAGAALLATLRVGQALGVAPQAFAAAHTGVRAYRVKREDYAVLSIDLGGYPGRNLSNFNDAALLGVRAGRIEWISPPTLFGPSPALLCLDGRGVPNAPRPGCSGWGHFSP